MTSTAMTTELTSESATWTNNCTNYFCISDDDYIDKIRDYVFPSTFEWVFVVLYAVVFIGGLAGNVDEALVSGKTTDRPSGRTEGLAGNALVCIVVWKNTPMRTVTNLFIVNLSTADLLVVLVCLPATVVGDITETWFVGRAFCKLIHYLQVSRSFDSSSLKHPRLPWGPKKAPAQAQTHSVATRQPSSPDAVTWSSDMSPSFCECHGCSQMNDVLFYVSLSVVII